MKFVSYNIEYSLGRDGRHDLERIVEAVHGADVIALQEVTRNFDLLPDADQPPRIAARLPDHCWIYGAPVDLDGSARTDDRRATNRRFQFGNMLLAP